MCFERFFPFLAPPSVPPARRPTSDDANGLGRGTQRRRVPLMQCHVLQGEESRRAHAPHYTRWRRAGRKGRTPARKLLGNALTLRFLFHERSATERA